MKSNWGNKGKSIVGRSELKIKQSFVSFLLETKSF